MYISIAETHNRLSQLLKTLDKGPITITKRGQPVGVLMAHDEYERLQRVQAYLQLVNLSKTLRDRDVTAVDLLAVSRTELEERA